MTNRSTLGFALVFAALILAASGGVRLAEDAGLIDAETQRRLMQALIGLGFAAYANLMPKQNWLSPGSAPRAEAWAQSGLRVGGWSLALGGLAYAAIWTFAPLAYAGVLAKAVLASAAAITLGYSLWSYWACRAASEGDTGTS